MAGRHEGGRARLLHECSHAATDGGVGNDVILRLRQTLGGLCQGRGWDRRFRFMGGFSSDPSVCPRWNRRCWLARDMRTRDVIPFGLASGQYARLDGLNVIRHAGASLPASAGEVRGLSKAVPRRRSGRRRWNGAPLANTILRFAGNLAFYHAERHRARAEESGRWAPSDAGSKINAVVSIPSAEIVAMGSSQVLARSTEQRLSDHTPNRAEWFIRREGRPRGQRG